jgi:hypothetical protein
MLEKPPKLLAKALRRRWASSCPATVSGNNLLGLLGENGVHVLEGEQRYRTVVAPLPELLDDGSVLCLADLPLRVEVLASVIAGDQVAQGPRRMSGFNEIAVRSFVFAKFGEPLR